MKERLRNRIRELAVIIEIYILLFRDKVNKDTTKLLEQTMIALIQRDAIHLLDFCNVIVSVVVRIGYGVATVHTNQNSIHPMC